MCSVAWFAHTNSQSEGQVELSSVYVQDKQHYDYRYCVNPSDPHDRTQERPADTRGRIIVIVPTALISG
jgi:hypothetical protein